MVEEASEEPIDLYFWTTPNGYKVSIMLEELAVPYRVHFIDISKGEQFDPSFLKIAANNKIPAIVDPEGPDGQPLALFESGAILLYLARKYDTLYPTNERRKAEVDQWHFWQIAGLGPMAGQCMHFRKFAKQQVPYAIERYTTEIARLFGVLEKRLEGRDFITGEYSIADIACYPWMRIAGDLGQDLLRFPNVAAWLDRVGRRPAVSRGLAVGQKVMS